MADFSIRMIVQSVTATADARRSGCPIRHPSPKKSPAPRMATTASLPCRRDQDLDLALLDVEHRIGGRALLKNDPIRLEGGNASTAIKRGEKHVWVEFGFGLPGHWNLSLEGCGPAVDPWTNIAAMKALIINEQVGSVCQLPDRCDPPRRGGSVEILFRVGLVAVWCDLNSGPIREFFPPVGHLQGSRSQLRCGSGCSQVAALRR
jgi:hypothetical protein